MLKRIDLKKALLYLFAGWVPGGRKRCNACGSAIWRFMPYREGSRSRPILMKELHVVGSDVDNFECPRCGGNDRLRHLLLYMDKCDTFRFIRGKAVLHFAPEQKLTENINDAKPARYVKADLFPSNESAIKVDIQKMPFDNNEFDLVIANHVLEHIESDVRGLEEVFRVLCPGGHAILQTPYSETLIRTWEDAGIQTETARREAYGQEDHMRLYGQDIFDRIISVGFTSLVRTHEQLLPDIDKSCYGVNSAEPYFLFKKPVQ